MSLDVDVVIPVYGNWDVTERCLESLRDRDDCVRRIIVVDDASPDDTAARLRARGDVSAVTLTTNRGFAAACNAGAAAADAGAIFFLNNDTLVPKGTIARLAAVLDADATIAAAGPRLLYADGTIQSAGGSLMAGAGRVGRMYAHLDGDVPEANVPGDFFGVSAAALMIRRADFLAAGRFDEAFVMGFEDVELSLRLWQRGRRVRYVPDVTIVHLEGVGRGKTFDDERNARLFASRWAGKLDAIPRFEHPGEPPCLAIAWHDRSPIDSLARGEFARLLDAHAGARVSFVRGPGSAAVSAVRARLDARALLRIAYGNLGPGDVRWCAPIDARDAAVYARHRGDEPLWVPSRRARGLLLDAGIAAGRIFVTHLGFSVTASEPRAPATVIVTSGPGGAMRAAAIRTALRPHVALCVDADRCDTAGLREIRTATLAIVDGPGDAWGLLGGTALAHGAVVVTTGDAPFVESMPRDAYIGVAACELAASAREIASDPARYAAYGMRARKETARRLPAVYAGHRIRELARAHVFGVPAPAMVQFTPQIASALRDADT